MVGISRLYSFLFLDVQTNLTFVYTLTHKFWILNFFILTDINWVTNDLEECITYQKIENHLRIPQSPSDLSYCLSQWFGSYLNPHATSGDDTSAKLSLRPPFTSPVQWHLLILAFLGLKGYFVLFTLCSSAFCH